MGAFFVFAGIMHFVKPKMYLRMMPPYIPWPSFMVYASGVAEFLLGLALFYEPIRNYAAWGIIALLIAIFPANIQMLIEYKKFKPIPRWGLILRLPLQAVLIWWAYQYT